ncbi:MAG: OsmC family protein [Bacteroidota bacterium]
MAKEHHYKTKVVWTGNKGEGTTNYKAYERSHTISIEHKPDILGSSDAPFLGDVTKHNPEDMFLSSLSVCHMLWFLHFCADNNIIVTAYTDNATGTMLQTDTGGGHFTSVTLYPMVTITDKSKIDLANSLHDEANKKCFIANSCNFKIKHEPSCVAN